MMVDTTIIDTLASALGSREVAVELLTLIREESPKLSEKTTLVCIETSAANIRWEWVEPDIFYQNPDQKTGHIERRTIELKEYAWWKDGKSGTIWCAYHAATDTLFLRQ